MLKKFLVGVALSVGLWTVPAHAGCSGTVIMGTCYGSEVPWDSHGDSKMRDDPPPGFYYDKRGTAEEREHPNDISPFTGRDANDSDWSLKRNSEQGITGW
jgi:hypothetical protein